MKKHFISALALGALCVVFSAQAAEGDVQNEGTDHGCASPDAVKPCCRHEKDHVFNQWGASVTLQPDQKPLYHWGVELNGTASGGDFTPLWLVSNRQGLSSVKKTNGYLRAGFFRESQYDRRFSWNFGVDLAGAAHYTSSFVIQQLYAGVRYRCLDLTIGAKEHRSEFVDPLLSSGDMVNSGNARPIPQARIAVERYTYIPYTKHKLAFKAYFAMGMFTDQDWQYTFTRGDYQRTKNVLYHGKGLFLRWGDTKKFPLTIEGGFEMATQWGGKVYLPDGQVINPGHSFKDMIKAIFAGGSSSDDPNLSPDKLNSAGNHLGQWSAAIAWTPKQCGWGGRLYYQHFFEDHSMMTWDYGWRDMLLGVEVKFPRNRFVSKFLYEYLITKDQSGPVYNDTSADVPEQVSGRDNYYNNWLYNAWQHWGMGIGNPLLMSPIYNANGQITFYNNRVKAHHFGVSGNPARGLDYRILFSYTRSWGSYAVPAGHVRNGVAALAEVGYRPAKLNGWGFRLGLGLDHGGLTGDNYGASLTISRIGVL